MVVEEEEEDGMEGDVIKEILEIMLVGVEVLDLLDLRMEPREQHYQKILVELQLVIQMIIQEQMEIEYIRIQLL